MVDLFENSIAHLVEELVKQMKEIEKAIFKLRSALFETQNQLILIENVLNYTHNYNLNTNLIIDNVEAEYKDDILNILIFDVPPIYKANTASDTLKWKEIINKAINLLPNKPRFNQAHVVFEFYVPEKTAIKADTDNRMIKTLLDTFVVNSVIPSDTMTHVSFSCIAFPITNMYPKTFIKVTERYNMQKIISLNANTSIAEKIPVSSNK